MIQVNRIYLIFNRLVTKKFLVDTSEKHFKIKFTSKEILSWNNLGEMIACIATK